MARGGMRIGEVLNLTPEDIDDQKLIIRKPKSGRASEVVFLPALRGVSFVRFAGHLDRAKGASILGLPASATRKRSTI